ncbi:30S ribosomal protein S1 [Galdieria sulphuraria]|uniref:30S ribosomal protein S1 (Plastid) n=1 Tax=Galdieria sulphuraria TaxID=130081 RepID=M2XXH5_GALSU|nr:30S ribosomal protein S1 [Galdieria sulphuraria]EME28139.1 30S ribosomal protein S1 [Galdieria sulphuraria]GJD12063.1 30S ribosomal protein S1 [Galdieria sulphuraria]|eukprot:XP_005704659.1 30S ribosomal protein S1 [Galdieria sulphuraria]
MGGSNHSFKRTQPCHMWCYIEAPIQTKNTQCIHRQFSCKSLKQVATSLRKLSRSNLTTWSETTPWLSGTQVGKRGFSCSKTVWELFKNRGLASRSWKEETTPTAVVLVRAEEKAVDNASGSSKKLLEDMWSKISSFNGNTMNGRVPVSHEAYRPRLVENKRKVMGKIPLPVDMPFSYGDLDKEVGDISYSFTAGDVRKGVIVEIINGGALVDIGAKSTALLPSNEVSLYPVESIRDVLQVGDEKEFVLLVADSDSGHPKVSIRRLELEIAWKKLNSALDEASTVEAQVVAVNRGGCLVLVYGIRGFLPISHISLPGTSLEEMVGHKYPVKCLEVDKSKGRLVVSHRRAMAERQMEHLKTGALVEGTVQGVKPYGVFVDVFGTSGLLHISQISHDQVANIQSLFLPGEKVKCMVVSFDKQRGRISLSTKALEPHPGDMLRNKQLVYEKAEEMALSYNQRMDSPVRSKNTTSSSTDDIIAGLDIGSLDDLDPILFGTHTNSSNSNTHSDHLKQDSMNGTIPESDI